MKSSLNALRLPPRVRSVAQAAVGGGSVNGELAWLSWAGTVWRLHGDGGTVYVKRAADLAAERDRLTWLSGRWPVPEVAGFLHASGDDWLLTRELPGVPLDLAAGGAHIKGSPRTHGAARFVGNKGGHPSFAWEPARVAQLFGEILRGLHDTDADGCPFGVARAGRVVIHGDYCLPNVLMQDGKLSGLLDVGQAGLGDPREDLAAGVWTLQYNFGAGHARDFLDAYGAPAMTDQEIERLRRRYAR
jgi:aminoglycoside phosphotransferase